MKMRTIFGSIDISFFIFHGFIYDICIEKCLFNQNTAVVGKRIFFEIAKIK